MRCNVMRCTLGVFVAILMLPMMFGGTAHAQKQEITISGRVLDNDTGEGLPGANVFVKGKYVGVAANEKGEFTLRTTVPTPFTLVISMIGYDRFEKEITSSETNLEVFLKPKTFMTNDIVVSASRVEENILRAPVSVEKMDQMEIRNTASITFWESLANMREVTLTANSLFFQSATGRGFGGTINRGFIQLIDGVDATGIANGQFAIGNLTSIANIDVAEVEFLPGASSALYGPNAFSGVMFINTKSPFEYPGISVSFKSGFTNSDYLGTKPFRGVEFRYAKAYDKFAFKIVGSDMRATDWPANDYSDRYGIGPNNPGYNGVNVYGDEIASKFDLDKIAGTPKGTLGEIFVARTGYREEDLVNYGEASTTKFSTSLRYRPNEDIEMSYDFRFGMGTAIYQGTNRYALKGIRAFYNKFEVKGQNFYVRAYTQKEGAGDSYDIVFAGWNVNRRWKSDKQWFGEYLQTYIGSVLQGKTPEEAHKIARSVADQGRYEPGSPEFNRALEEVIATKDFATGAGFISRSGYYNAEAMYNFADKINFIELQVGGNFRFYDVNTAGTIYSDANEKIKVWEYGLYAQATKRLMEDRLRLTGSLRLDGHKNYPDRISPRVAAVYSPSPNHNFRASYQAGFNNPVIESQYIFLNLGPIVLLGGTQDNMDRTGLGRIYERGISLETLKPVKTPFRKPEYQTSIEVGYKGLIGQSLFIDLNYYQSDYVDRFKGVRVLDPDLFPQKIMPYALYTNELDKNVVIRGAGASITYNFDNGYRISTHYNFIERAGGTDDLLTSLNRAKHHVKVVLGNPRVTRNLGFNIAARWRSAFYYVATFGEGPVDEEFVIDAQVTYKLPQWKTAIRFGANNLLGQNYRQAYGSALIGRMFFVAITYDSFFNR